MQYMKQRLPVLGLNSSQCEPDDVSSLARVHTLLKYIPWLLSVMSKWRGEAGSDLCCRLLGPRHPTAGRSAPWWAFRLSCYLSCAGLQANCPTKQEAELMITAAFSLRIAPTSPAQPRLGRPVEMPQRVARWVWHCTLLPKPFLSFF